MDNLLLGFQRAGLIQFGHFVDHASHSAPLRLSFDFLPSYPALLKQTIAALSDLCGRSFDSFDFLCATAEGLPIGMAMSLAADKPLLYSTHRIGHAHDFIGAYDVGHPTVLIIPVFEDEEKTARLARDVRRVGLEVQGVLSLVTLRAPLSLRVATLYTMDAVLDALHEADAVPQHQADVVRAWLANLHHQG